MSKILSLDSVKTCLKKLKDYVDAKATTLKTDIDGRVPKTQVATQNGGPGIVSIKDLSGIKVTNGALSIDEATAEEVQQQTNHYSPITPGRLPEVFKTYGIENEQDVPILKQTIGYESRNLFDYKKKPDISQYIDGLQIDIADEIHISGNKQYDGEYANWYWTVSDYLNLANKRITATITGEGTEYLKVALYNADHKHVDVSGSIVTDSKTDYNRICVYIATNDTVSNIDAHITISVTDEHISDTTFYPYTPTVNDRFLALEGLIKKKTFNNITSSSTSGYDTHMAGIIPLSASCSSNIDGASIRCFCWVSYGGNIDITFFNKEHSLINNQSVGDVTLYYIDLKSLTIQDTTEPAQSVQSAEELPSFEYLQEEPSHE